MLDEELYTVKEQLQGITSLWEGISFTIMLVMWNLNQKKCYNDFRSAIIVSKHCDGSLKGK